MKNIRIFLSENFHFWVVTFSIYLNRRVFVMDERGVMGDAVAYYVSLVNVISLP